MSEKSELERTVASLVASEGWGAETWDARRGEHPPAELLAGWVTGEVAEAEAEALQDHLAACRECAAVVVDLADLANLPPMPGEPTDFQVAASWRSLRARLAAAAAEAPDTEPEDAASAFPPPPAVAAASFSAPEPRPVSQLVPPAPQPEPAARRRWNWSRPAVSWAAAAAMLVACLGFASWGLHVHARLDELLVPVPNVPVVDLDGGDTRGAASEVEVSAAGPYYLLVFYPVLDSAVRESALDYAWTLRGEDGAEVLAGEGLELQPGDYFTLLLHREALPGGAYRIRISGRTDDGPVAVGEQTFRLDAGG